MPELKFRIALTRLHRGDPKAALNRIGELLQFILVEYKATDPDPVEWAYYILALLCLQRVDEAWACATHYTELRHEELDRMRLVADVLKHGRVTVAVAEGDGQARRSIHQMPARSREAWLAGISQILLKCGQARMADMLSRGVAADLADPGRSREQLLSYTHPQTGRKRPKSLRSFRRRVRLSKMAGTAKRRVRFILRRLEWAYGNFLPYHLSAMRNDEFFREVRERVGDEHVRTVLIIGAGSGSGPTESALAGAGESQSPPLLFCLNTSTRRFRHLRERMTGNVRVNCQEIHGRDSLELSEALDRRLALIAQEHRIDTFDLVLIDAAGLGGEMVVGPALREYAHTARFALLHDIGAFNNLEVYEELSKDSRISEADCNPDLRKGYAVFKRETEETV
jgi:hypothetical protein